MGLYKKKRLYPMPTLLLWPQECGLGQDIHKWPWRLWAFRASPAGPHVHPTVSLSQSLNHHPIHRIPSSQAWDNSTYLLASLPVFNSYGYSLSQCEGFSACLLFSSLCRILCPLGKYLPANCFWPQIHGPSWWRSLTNHPRSAHPGGATQYLSLSTKWGKKSESVSHSIISDSAILWTVPHQAPLSMGFPRQEYWGGLPFPSSDDLPYPGIKLESPELQADSLSSEPPGTS